MVYPKILVSTLFLFLLAGCSPDEPFREAPAETATAHKKSSQREPHNPSNRNDHVGLIYGQLLDAHYNIQTAGLNLGQLIDRGETLAFLNPGFVSLVGQSSYMPLKEADVQPYFPANQPIETLLSTDYGPRATGILFEIASGLDELKGKDATYQEVYSYMLAIESSIVFDEEISQDEEDALLTTTSIIRTALHHDKKRRRRDRDWEWMTSNFAATANAALDSQPQAIMMSFATDVYSN